MVVEVVPERLDLKLAVFAQLGQLAKPEAILASNTSGLDIDALAAASERPDKVIGMHFFNPPPTMPLVEIVRATATSDETFAAVMALAQDLDKTPVAVANSPRFCGKPHPLSHDQRGHLRSPLKAWPAPKTSTG